MEEEKKTKEMEEKINEQIDKKINSILEQGIQAGNVDFLYKIVDIKKDMAKIKKEEENMMYGEYGEGSYGRRSRDSRGRYTEGGSYGRRGVKGTGRGRYRGEDMMDEMAYHYGNYMESGRYGAEAETTEALEYMMEATTEFIKMLKEEAKSPEELKIIKHYSKKISEM